MRLHLIRHGETRHNVDGRIQGDLLDDDLNEVGRAQATALRAHYEKARAGGLVIAAAYTSPLQRARSTAIQVAAAVGVPRPTALPGVREIGWGHHMGKLNVDETRVDMMRVLTAWEKGDLAAHVAGGETPAQAWERAQKDITPLFEKHAGEDIVLVAHGRINKIMMSGLINGDLHHMEAYPQANAGMNIMEGPRPWRLAQKNITTHLSGMRALDERH